MFYLTYFSSRKFLRFNRLNVEKQKKKKHTILACKQELLVRIPNNNSINLRFNCRWSRRHGHGVSGGTQRDVIDYRTGYIKSHLRSPSGRVR